MGVAGWAITAFMVLLLATIATFMIVGSYSRKETVPGSVQPTAGAIRISTSTPGVVSEIHVEEGQIVAAGDPILTVSTDRSVSSVGIEPSSLSALMDEGALREEVATIRQAEAQAQVTARSVDDVAARRRGLEDDQVQLRLDLDLQRERVKLAEQTLEAGRQLHDRQLFSTLQLRQREEALLSARQGVSSIEREIRRNQSTIEQLGAEAGRLRAQASQIAAEAAATKAQMDQRKASRMAERAIVLVAAKAGRVVALQARVGAPVQPGRALAIILPPGASLQAELWVPSRAVGLLEPGDRVRLMYDAFPYQKFGVGRGLVKSIAGAPTDPSELPVAIETKESLYRVVVQLQNTTVTGYGRQWPLSPGMRLSADLVLDERSLWEWLLEPVIAAQRRGQTG